MIEAKKYIRYWFSDETTTSEEEIVTKYYSYDSDDEIPRVTNGFLSQVSWDITEQEAFENETTIKIRSFIPEEFSDDAVSETISYYYSYYTVDKEKEDVVQGFCKDCVHCYEISKKYKPLKNIPFRFNDKSSSLICDARPILEYVTGETRYKYCFEYNLNGECRLYEKRPEFEEDSENNDEIAADDDIQDSVDDDVVDNDNNSDINL